MSRRFNHVSMESFLAVDAILNKTAWATHRGAPSAGLNATVVATHASLLFDSLDKLAAMLGSNEERRKEMDARWDLAQQRFTSATHLMATAPDPDLQRNAQLIVATLLWPSGTSAQVQMTYEREVDFGLQQIRLSQEPHIAAALTAAGLDPYFQDVITTTQALADAIGREPGISKEPAPSVRRRQAHRACVLAFEHVYAGLEYLIAATSDPSERDALRALLTPLTELSDRSRYT